MRKHLKFVLYLIAIALVAVLIFDLRSHPGRRTTVEEGEVSEEAPALQNIVEAEFLGILGLAFVAIAAGYVSSLVKGGGGPKALTAQTEAGEVAVSVEESPARKLILEKALGTTGARIVSALVVTIFILVVLAMLVFVAFLLFPDKVPFLRDLFIGACP